MVALGDAEYDCSFKPESVSEYRLIHGQQVPLQSVAEWRRYYELMGRDKKVEMIDSFLHE